MKNSGYIILLVVIGLHFTADNCYAQKDKVLTKDKIIGKIPKITIPVKTGRFQSNDIKNARTEYMSMTKSEKPANVFLSLRKKGHSNTAILATVRYSKVPDFSLRIVNNTDIAEDAQLMLKAIPTLTAADMIRAIRDLYDLSTPNLFNVALLTLQYPPLYFTGRSASICYCDCVLRNPADVASGLQYRRQLNQHMDLTGYYKKLYPWQCFKYWNTGFRSVILPETNLNNYLHLMRLSQYPLYEGISSADLADPTINFTVIMGTPQAALTELMEYTTLFSDHIPYDVYCNLEIPTQTSVTSVEDNRYMGTCKHISVINTRFYLKDVLTMFKRNGFSATTLVTAAKTRFAPLDDDLRQRIIASFDLTVFAATEILQASNVMNSN